MDFSAPLIAKAPWMYSFFTAAGTAKVHSVERIDPAAFRAYLINAILIAGTLAAVTFCCCAFTLVYEVNAIRLLQMQGITDTQHGLFSRIDSLLWKADTFLITFSATNQSLAKGLTQVRV